MITKATDVRIEFTDVNGEPITLTSPSMEPPLPDVEPDPVIEKWKAQAPKTWDFEITLDPAPSWHLRIFILSACWSQFTPRERWRQVYRLAREGIGEPVQDDRILTLRHLADYCLAQRDA